MSRPYHRTMRRRPARNWERFELFLEAAAAIAAVAIFSSFVVAHWGMI